MDPSRNLEVFAGLGPRDWEVTQPGVTVFYDGEGMPWVPIWVLNNFHCLGEGNPIPSGLSTDGHHDLEE